MKTRIFIDDGFPEAREYDNNYHFVDSKDARQRLRDLLEIQKAKETARKREGRFAHIHRLWRRCSPRSFSA